MANTTKQLECDYLIIGAGAASLAFVDTLLTELPEAKLIIIDQKSIPGGHWVDAYGFVRLHQPSLVYGIASRQLEGNWARLMLTKFQLPWHHRASKQEILTYFGDFVADKVSAGQVEFYPSCTYDFGRVNDDGLYSFSSVDGKMKYSVKVNVKVVNGVTGACIIPSQSPLQFPVDHDINVMTPNQVYDAYADRQSAARSKKMKYVILGAGKTAMDSIVFLQRNMKVDPSNIAWVIPNDVWILSYEGNGNPWIWPKALMEHDLDADRAAEALERKGSFVRIDKKIKPTQFRFPLIKREDLKLLQNIKTIIRRGRATAIRKDGTNVRIEFGDSHPAWTAFAPAEMCVFVHATSPGPFNGSAIDDLFVSEKEMTLSVLTAPPISSSMSLLAKLEAARRKGTLDLDFGRRLVLALEGFSEECFLESKHSENDILRILVRGLILGESARGQLKAIINLATFIALLDDDPMVAYQWMKGNRLCFLSIPGFKCEVFEDMMTLCEKGERLGFSSSEIAKFKLLAGKLNPLEGM